MIVRPRHGKDQEFRTADRDPGKFFFGSVNYLTLLDRFLNNAA
jgi:hypothetical protein